MNIQVVNSQKSCRLNIRCITRFFSVMAGNLQAMTPATKWSDLSLVLTDNAGIRLINRRFLNSTDTTDVISFRYAPVPGEVSCASGEIFVNTERALEYGPLYGDCSRELALYIAHGCDHLSGQDDNTRSGYARMRRRELRWLRTAAAAGLLSRPLLAGTGSRHRVL